MSNKKPPVQIGLNIIRDILNQTDIASIIPEDIETKLTPVHKLHTLSKEEITEEYALLRKELKI